MKNNKKISQLEKQSKESNVQIETVSGGRYDLISSHLTFNGLSNDFSDSKLCESDKNSVETIL